MYVVKKCPQCGTGEGVYTEYPLYDDYGLLICYCCGFAVKNYFDPKSDDERNPTPGVGYGFKRFTYASGGANFGGLSVTDYDEVIASFDHLVSTGVIIPGKSYITKAEGNNVTFLRGEKKNIKDSFPEDYKAWISTANSHGEIENDFY